jgi:hypothetical protein
LHHLLKAASDRNPPTYASWLVGIAGVSTMPVLFFDIEFHWLLFVWLFLAGLKPWSCYIYLPSRWDFKCEPPLLAHILSY